MRPIVKVNEYPAPGSGKWAAVCHTGTCRWSYRNGVKSDVQQQATWHRQQHRREGR